MQDDKKLLLRAAGFGAGFAVAGAVIIAAAMWWAARPAKPKPWNRKAIIAEYQSVRPIEGGSKLRFTYSLENRTDGDFRVYGDANIHLGAELARSKSMNFPQKGRIEVAYPIFVPAKSKVLLDVDIPRAYSASEFPNASADEQYDYETNLAKYVATQMSNLNGFVFMDDGTRYEIDLPNGWAERAKQPMKVITSK